MRFFLCVGSWTHDRVALGDYGSWRAARAAFESLAADLAAGLGGISNALVSNLITFLVKAERP